MTKPNVRELLRRPVVVAPMAGGPSTAALVVAAAEAEPFVFLAAGYKSVGGDGRPRSRAVRAGGAEPFGVNVFVPGAPASDADALTALSRHARRGRRGRRCDARRSVMGRRPVRREDRGVARRSAVGRELHVRVPLGGGDRRVQGRGMRRRGHRHPTLGGCDHLRTPVPTCCACRATRPGRIGASSRTATRRSTGSRPGLVDRGDRSGHRPSADRRGRNHAS